MQLLLTEADSVGCDTAVPGAAQDMVEAVQSSSSDWSWRSDSS